jgi:DNA-binding beta-propeller fold protein YncE
MKRFLRVAILGCLPALGAERIERAGVSLDFSLAALDGGPLRAGGMAELRLEAGDARTGQPMTGIHALAFLLSRPADPRAIDSSCEDKVRRRLVSHMGVRGDISFDGYLVLTLNRDNTISFVNPLVNNPAGLVESLVTLPGPGYDWALTPDRNLLLVTIPRRRAVAVIDTNRRRLAKLIEIAGDGEPAKIVVESGGRRAWVGLDGASRVATIDLDTKEVGSLVETGGGSHDLALDADGLVLMVTNSEAGSVTIVDIRAGRAVGEVGLKGSPGPIAFDPASRYFLAAGSDTGLVAAVDPVRHRVFWQVESEPGISAIGIPAGGRFAWIANPVTGKVTTLDTATGALAAEYSVGGEPAKLAFSNRFAYVYRRITQSVSAIPLARDGSDSPAELATPQAEVPREAMQTLANPIAVAPAGDWIFFGRAANGALLQASDGLSVAPETIGVDKRAPVAVLVVDRSLRETEPGVYRATLKVNWGGAFDVPVLVDNVLQCFRVSIEGPVDPEAAKRWPRLRVPRVLNSRLEAGRDLVLRLALEDLSGSPVLHIPDMRLLIQKGPDGQQQWVRPVHAGEGVWEAPVRFESVGVYTVLLSSRSQGAALPTPVAELTVEGEKK